MSFLPISCEAVVLLCTGRHACPLPLLIMIDRCQEPHLHQSNHFVCITTFLSRPQGRKKNASMYTPEKFLTFSENQVSPMLKKGYSEQVTEKPT